MEHFLNMLDAQLVLFVYIGVGAYCKKKGIIEDEVKRKITGLILKITMPCMIFSSFNRPLSLEIMKKTGLAVFIATVIAFLSYFLGLFIYNRFPSEKKSILQYCTMVNNSGFLGLPLVSSVFGEEGLLYASFFILPNRVMMWTAGLSIFTNSGSKGGGSRQEKLRNFRDNILLNPCIVTVYLGLLRRICNILLPEFLDTAVSKIGAMTSPLSMMIIGTMLVGVKLSDLFDSAALYQSFIRLLLLPLIALLGMKLLRFEPVLTGSSLILTGMPAGSTSVLLATRYGADDRFASRLVISSTILSLITAPLLMFLIE